jgi:hypothetical protein
LQEQFDNLFNGGNVMKNGKYAGKASAKKGSSGGGKNGVVETRAAKKGAGSKSTGSMKKC